ncbi:hypothetical protein HK104_005735 [Borealophlyctis nickersoniae]|nr:hypothetical protein HK104_005735 [Borealophlyctis nickersoniae]
MDDVFRLVVESYASPSGARALHQSNRFLRAALTANVLLLCFARFLSTKFAERALLYVPSKQLDADKELSLVTLLLRRGADPAVRGYTILYHYITRGRTKIVRLLLTIPDYPVSPPPPERFAEINGIVVRGTLSAAVASKRARIVKLLLGTRQWSRLKASIEVGVQVDAAAATAVLLEEVESNGRYETVQLQKLLNLACQLNHVKVLKVLKTFGEAISDQPNAPSYSLLEAMCSACKHGSLESVQFLLSQNVYIPSARGEKDPDSPLGVAIRAGRLNVIKHFFEVVRVTLPPHHYGLDWVAASTDSVDPVKTLNYLCWQYRTAPRFVRYCLEIAIENNNLTIAEHLLSRFALNPTFDYTEWSQTAIRSGHPRMVSLVMRDALGLKDLSREALLQCGRRDGGGAILLLLRTMLLPLGDDILSNLNRRGRG